MTAILRCPSEFMFTSSAGPLSFNNVAYSLSVRAMRHVYQLRDRDDPLERIQHTWMRLAVTLHGRDLARVLEAYELFSQGFYTHASPTIFNAGLRSHQLVSCYVPQVDISSETSPFNTAHDVAKILMANGTITGFQGKERQGGRRQV